MKLVGVLICDLVFDFGMVEVYGFEDGEVCEVVFRTPSESESESESDDDPLQGLSLGNWKEKRVLY